MSSKQAAIEIIGRLQEHGFRALLAGGCVRDMLLGRPAKDYDVATNALPADVTRLFRRTLQVGAKFGVVIVLLQREQVEVATFRSEAGYEDGRHPTEVRFTSAGRGRQPARLHHQRHVLRPAPRAGHRLRARGRPTCSGASSAPSATPEERFGEDYLRMLRAVRFSTRLGFAIEPETYAAIRRNAAKHRPDQRRADRGGAGGNSRPSESCRRGGHADGDGVGPGDLSGFCRRSGPSGPSPCWAGCERRWISRWRWRRSLRALPRISPWRRCEILKLSRKQDQRIEFLLAHRGRLLDAEMSLAALKKLLAGPYFWDLYELERAIQKAAGAKAGLAALGRLRRRIRDLGDIDVKPKPLLNGHDLMHLGATPGPALGQLAEELYVAQLEGDVQTTRSGRAVGQSLAPATSRGPVTRSPN